MKLVIKYAAIFSVLCFFSACNQDEATVIYDTVILNARVIDPETNTDGLLNVGILGDKIAIITDSPIEGKTTVDGTGKVLAPGFIDLHAHGQTNKENEYQAFDGVTTALELEVGVDTLSSWLKIRKGKALLNYGASACQLAYRNKLLRGNDAVSESIFDELADSVAQIPLPESKFPALEQSISKAIEEGAIGIGIPVGYLPAASVEEIAAVYEMAGKWQVPIFSHVREGGAIAFQQAIADAVLNEAPLHICHINSMARKDILFCLDLVKKAQARKFAITTELYPYTAGNTEIGSAIFNDGWQERLGCSHKDLQWVATGERLTPETFDQYRKEGGSVIVHMLEEAWVDAAIVSPFTMIASDGGDYSPNGHPRGSGSYCKILRKYVRENQLIDLPTAIKKMTLMPAQVLEKTAPEMKLRGRIQVGCYADLILFDPETVKDLSTYTNGFVHSEGMNYVWINGTALIANGKMRENVYPGIAIKGQKVRLDSEQDQL